MTNFYQVLQEEKPYFSSLEKKNHSIEGLLQTNISSSLENFALLSSDKALPFIEQIAIKAQTLSQQRHGKNIQFYAPIYLSNECTNSCSYCSFSMEHKIKRKTLSLKEFNQEAKHLYNKGFRHILLVAGEHKKIVNPTYIMEVVEIAKQYFSQISLEVAPFSKPIYQDFQQAGIDSLTLYQETYNESSYKQHHIRGLKRNFANRLQAIEDAASANFRTINMGVLLGLEKEYMYDCYSLVLHLQYMMKKFWRTQYGISLPRICDNEGSFKSLADISDIKFVQLILSFRLTFPDLFINLSTRENQKLRDNLIKLGITHMSAESITQPGGYTNDKEELTQFTTHDNRSLKHIEQVISSQGYESVYKNWEKVLF